MGGGRCRLDSLCGGAEFSFSDASQFANCESPTITSVSDERYNVYVCVCVCGGGGGGGGLLSVGVVKIL